MKVAIQELRSAFRSFDKWKTYGFARDLKKAGKVRQLDIYDAAALVGILPSVARMRLADLEKQKGGSDE